MHIFVITCRLADVKLPIYHHIYSSIVFISYKIYINFFHTYLTRLLNMTRNNGNNDLWELLEEGQLLYLLFFSFYFRAFSFHFDVVYNFSLFLFIFVPVIVNFNRFIDFFVFIFSRLIDFLRSLKWLMYICNISLDATFCFDFLEGNILFGRYKLMFWERKCRQYLNIFIKHQFCESVQLSSH